MSAASLSIRKGKKFAAAKARGSGLLAAVGAKVGGWIGEGSPAMWAEVGLCGNGGCGSLRLLRGVGAFVFIGEENNQKHDCHGNDQNKQYEKYQDHFPASEITEERQVQKRIHIRSVMRLRKASQGCCFSF